MKPRVDLEAVGAFLVVLSISAAAVLGAAAASAIGPPGDLAASAGAAVVVAGAAALTPLRGLLAFLVVALVADTLEHWTGVSLRLFDEIAIALVTVVALTVHRRRVVVPARGWREAGLAALLIAGIASSLVNGVPAVVWVPGLVLFGKGIGLFYLVLALRPSADELRPVALAGLGIGLAIAGMGAVETLDPAAFRSALGLPPYDQTRGGLQVVKSIFLHPALYGWLTAFLSLVLYARFLVLRSPLALVAAVALNVGTLLSGRRTPLIGALAGLVVGAVRQLAGGWLTTRIWLPLAGALVLFAIASLPVLGRFYERTLAEYGAPPEMVAELLSPDPDREVLRQMQPRIALYVGSLAIARDELPLGAGIGRYGSQMSREVYSPVYVAYGMDGMYGIKPERPIAVTDTYWPMILGETGVIGLAGAFVFFGALLADLWRAAGRTASAPLRAAVLGALLVCVEALVRSLTSSVFSAPPIAYVVFATGAAALAASASRATGAPQPDEEGQGQGGKDDEVPRIANEGDRGDLGRRR